jgi:hypothetical protein
MKYLKSSFRHSYSSFRLFPLSFRLFPPSFRRKPKSSKPIALAERTSNHWIPPVRRIGSRLGHPASLYRLRPCRRSRGMTSLLGPAVKPRDDINKKSDCKIRNSPDSNALARRLGPPFSALNTDFALDFANYKGSVTSANDNHSSPTP